MKKKLFLIIIIVLLFLTGCTSTKRQLTCMEKSYFDIVDKVAETGSITSTQIKDIINNNLLDNKENQIKEYTFEGDFYSVPSTINFRFKDNNEVLTVEYNKDTGLFKSVIYELPHIDNSDNINTLLSFNVNSYETNDYNLIIKSTFNELYDRVIFNKVMLNTYDINYDTYKHYISIYEKLHNKENISHDYIENLLPKMEISYCSSSKFECKSDSEVIKLDTNSIYYSGNNINMYTTQSGKHTLTIYPTTLEEQRNLYKLIY